MYQVKAGTLTLPGFLGRARELHRIRALLAGEPAAASHQSNDGGNGDANSAAIARIQAAAAAQHTHMESAMLAANRAKSIRKQFPVVFPDDVEETTGETPDATPGDP